MGSRPKIYLTGGYAEDFDTPVPAAGMPVVDDAEISVPSIEFLIGRGGIPKAFYSEQEEASWPVWPYFQCRFLNYNYDRLIPATNTQTDGNGGEGLLVQHYIEYPFPILPVGRDVKNFAILFTIQC